VFKKIIGAAMAAGSLLSASAQAAVLTTDESGALLGATGVLVGDRTYTVKFLDGTCQELFAGCSLEDFTFKTLETASLAAQALLDQVFTDGPSGNFDSDPKLTNGCEASADRFNFCNVIIPYTFWTDGSVIGRRALNNAITSLYPDLTGSMGILATLNTSGMSNYAYATFFEEAPVSAVPLPGALPLAAAGFGIFGFLRRRARA
jgi:hypothetical protein